VVVGPVTSPVSTGLRHRKLLGGPDRQDGLRVPRANRCVAAVSMRRRPGRKWAG